MQLKIAARTMARSSRTRIAISFLRTVKKFSAAVLTLYSSSSGLSALQFRLDHLVDLACEVPLEAADGLLLRLALAGAPGDVPVVTGAGPAPTLPQTQLSDAAAEFPSEVFSLPRSEWAMQPGWSAPRAAAVVSASTTGDAW